MDGIIERLLSGQDLRGKTKGLEDGDDEFSTLALTSECETHELPRFLSALSANTSVRRVVFRESFFPLRRIRQHLSLHDYISYLQGVGRLARDTLELHPSMKGMVRGQLLATIILPGTPSSQSVSPPSLKCLIAISSLTLIDCRDVAFLADALYACDQLEHVVLKECFLSFFREDPLLNPLISMLATRPRLKRLELSCSGKDDGNQRSISDMDGRRSRSFPFFDAEVLEVLLSSTARRTLSDLHHHLLSMESLESLSLCNLGLQDEHFEVIAGHLRQNRRNCENNDKAAVHVNTSAEVSSLRFISLDGNHPTQEGLDAMVLALTSRSQCVQRLSMKTNRTLRPSCEILEQVFESNYTLKMLCLDYDNQHEQEQQKLEFFLRLNQFGRKDILANTTSACTTKLWSKLVEHIHDDPSAMYYFLKSAPGVLCCK